MTIHPMTPVPSPGDHQIPGGTAVVPVRGERKTPGTGTHTKHARIYTLRGEPAMCRSIAEGGRRCPGGGRSTSPAAPTPATRPTPEHTQWPDHPIPSWPASTARTRVLSDPRPAEQLPMAPTRLLPDLPANSVETRIAHAWLRLGGIEEQWGDLTGRSLRLTEIRALCPDIPRTDFDNAVRRLEQHPDAWVIPEDDQQHLTPADRDAAVRVGIKDMHLIRFAPTGVSAIGGRR